MANLSFFIIFWVFCVCVTASYMYTHYHRMLSKSDQEKNQALCEGWRRVSMGSARAHARSRQAGLFPRFSASPLTLPSALGPSSPAQLRTPRDGRPGSLPRSHS